MGRQRSEYDPVMRAIENSDLDGLRTIIANGGSVNLDDAATALWIVSHQEPENFDAGCRKWLGRFLVEERQQITMRDVRQAVAVLHPNRYAEELHRLLGQVNPGRYPHPGMFW